MLSVRSVARTPSPRADVGKRARTQRERAGIRPEELAAQAHVSLATISRLERGHIPRGDRFAAIAAALGTTVEALLNGGDDNGNGEAA